ncbi:MAG TPA: DUF2846 domain-containing protein [Ramlibacter sp.]|uniref:DUF2846 domain-containing protein n=1 Tax=Ramlibacter sp. TaxID=1917967 RepID=UPI002ED1647F
MRRSVLKIVAAGAVLLVAGCAATGARHEEMAGSIPSLKAGEGRIYFYRQSTMVGAALAPDVKLNKDLVGEARTGGFFYVDRPAGNYVASSAGETEKTVSFSLAPGETKYVRMYMNMGLIQGRLNLEVVPPTQGRAEIGSLAYVGKPIAAK